MQFISFFYDFQKVYRHTEILKPSIKKISKSSYYDLLSPIAITAIMLNA